MKRDVTDLGVNRKYWKAVVICFEAAYLVFYGISAIKFNPHICYIYPVFLELAGLKMRSGFSSPTEIRTVGRVWVITGRSLQRVTLPAITTCYFWRTTQRPSRKTPPVLTSNQFLRKSVHSERSCNTTRMRANTTKLTGDCAMLRNVSKNISLLIQEGNYTPRKWEIYTFSQNI